MRRPFLTVARTLRISGSVLVVLLGLTSPGLSGAEAASMPDGWFAWPSLEPVAGTAPDASALNAKPAGAAGRILVRDGHFATPDGRRVNFWGCNLSAEVAFPPVDELPALARRLAKGGVNIARLHHLDNEWAVNRGGSLWPRGHTNHEQVDPAQLDRVFRLVAALKAEGIYSNLNLKVSRSLLPGDGFPEAVRDLPLYQKRVDIFDARMIELQKTYARQLLATKNPYTGLTLAEDPAVAIIEINNENSLLGFWTRDLGRGLDRLPEPWRSDLTAKWNAWLARRYVDDTALGQAWNAGTSMATNALPPGATWEAKLTSRAQMTITPGSDARALTADITQVTGTDWHAQIQMHGVPITEGESYTVTFRARADRPRTIGVGLGLDTRARPGESWRSFGLLDGGRIGTEWASLRFAFTAHSTGGAPGCLQFNVGQAAGRIEIQDIALTAGAEGTGLLDGQSLRDGTVPIPTLASRRQWADWIHFLADIERAYADEMRRFLREELGVTAPMICSQVEYGGLTGVWREQDMEFVDTHAYWEHPVLENGDFDSPNWTVGNSPQIAAFARGELGELGSRTLLRVAGRPFAISEYDHSAPSEYACEMYPTLATIAALQNWDALYPFDIGITGQRNPGGTIGRFFDQLNHPAKWGLGPFAARVFRTASIDPIHIAQLNLPPLPWRDFLHADLGWQSAFNRDELDPLNTRFELHPGGDRDSWQGRIVGLEGNPPPRIALQSAPAGPVYLVGEDSFAVAAGYIGGADVAAGNLSVACEPFGLNFATVALVALDQRRIPDSRRLLLTIVGRAQNQGIKWNDERTSLGADWGHGPPIVERVPATITVQGAAGLRVYALAADGTRARRVKASRRGDDLTFSVGARDATIHYEITQR